MDKNEKIYIAGSGGLVGSALIRNLKREGYENLVYKNSSELDLRNQYETEKFFEEEKPDYVFDAAAKVGGIFANMNFSAEFIYDNLQIQTNLIHSAHKNKVKKFVFFGSNCMYPFNCLQPMKEEFILSSYPEPTNEPYAIAKIAGLKMAQSYKKQYGDNFITIIPASLYGPGDDFLSEGAHLIPSLIRKVHQAKRREEDSIQLWGTGNPRREFLYVDDLAEAAIMLMQNYESENPLNIGTGEDFRVNQIAGIVKKVVGFGGGIEFDNLHPDGVMKKLLDSSKIKSMGWTPKISFEEGIENTYLGFLSSK